MLFPFWFSQMAPPQIALPSQFGPLTFSEQQTKNSPRPIKCLPSLRTPIFYDLIRQPTFLNIIGSGYFFVKLFDVRLQ